MSTHPVALLLCESMVREVIAPNLSEQFGGDVVQVDHETHQRWSRVIAEHDQVQLEMVQAVKRLDKSGERRDYGSGSGSGIAPTGPFACPATSGGQPDESR